jgi:hypothetical protein
MVPSISCSQAFTHLCAVMLCSQQCITMFKQCCCTAPMMPQAAVTEYRAPAAVAAACTGSPPTMDNGNWDGVCDGTASAALCSFICSDGYDGTVTSECFVGR